jgi:hypothetical protein
MPRCNIRHGKGLFTVRRKIKLLVKVPMGIAQHFNQKKFAESLKLSLTMISVSLPISLNWSGIAMRKLDFAQRWSDDAKAAEWVKQSQYCIWLFW